MKKTLEIENTNSFFDALMQSSYFKCKEITSGLKVDYNGIVSVMGKPSVKILRLSDDRVSLSSSPSIIMLIVSLMITAFFWTIALLAAYREPLRLAGVIIALAAPSVIWLLDLFVYRRLTRLIFDEIENIER